MKTLKLIIGLLFMLTLFSCKKDGVIKQVIPIPNGNFELWDNMPNLLSWKTNSCPACVPPYETYIIKKVSDVSNGNFAAQFIYNNVYQSKANNKFPILLHPSALTGYIKSTITNGDTATIHIDLFSGTDIIDSGNWYETSSTLNYTKIEIPLSQTHRIADSAEISILGGRKQQTELYVDNLVFLKKM